MFLSKIKQNEKTRSTSQKTKFSKVIFSQLCSIIMFTTYSEESFYV